MINKYYLDICINDQGRLKVPPIMLGYCVALVKEFHGNIPKVIEVEEDTENDYESKTK